MAINNRNHYDGGVLLAMMFISLKQLNKCLLLFCLCLPAWALALDSSTSVVAYHVDLRVQVLQLPALKQMARDISAMGFNTLLMEWEGTYPYNKYRIISNRYAYTRSELKEFMAYCHTLGLDVIPLQQTLGHMEYILRHEEFAYLRADKKDYSQIDPTRLAAANALFTELLDDVIASHPSQYVHIGGDETWLLACDRCRAAWGNLSESAGKSLLYVNYMKMMAEIVISKGKTPLMWADMILAHPEAIKEMPKGVIYVDWNYGWAFNRFGEEPRNLIKQYGLHFWGATAVRSWPDDYHINSWNTHLRNQLDYVAYAKEAGFSGMVLTSWSTSGTYSYEWFSSEIVDLTPIREVYPHTYPDNPFRMTTEAFIQSVQGKNALSADQFAIDYGQRRFGLTEQDATLLWTILSSSRLNELTPIGSAPLSGEKALAGEPAQVTDDIKSKLLDVRQFLKQLKGMNPKSHKREFKHVIMQVELREFYLEFRQVQQQTQSPDFNKEQEAAAITSLQVLMDQGNQLKRRFNGLFRATLYPSELEQLHEYRMKNVRLLYQRLSRNR